jgi:protein O-GlcNAc transferase
MQSPHSTIIESALVLHRSGDLTGAARLYADALAQAPENADALCYLAMIRCQQAQFDQGIDLLRRAVAVAPRRASAHNLLGMAYHRLGRLDAAIASLDAAIACEPSLADAHGNRASVLLDLRSYSEAVLSCDRAIALMPDSITDWCTRGTALAELARHEEAILSYEEALARAPRLAEAHFNRGQCLAKLGRYEEALSAYSHALSTNPRMIEALNDQGNVLKKLGRHEEALASYDTAIGLSPEFAEAFCNRGNALGALKRYAEALASYDRAITLKPSHAEALQNRGIVLTKLGRPAEALADFDRAIELRPNSAELMYFRANVLDDLRRHNDALASCDRAIELNPHYAEGLYYRGYLLTVQGRLQEALASYDQAIALDPDQTIRFLGDRLFVKMRLCEWHDLERDSAQLISAVENNRCVEKPLPLLLIRSTLEQQLKCAQLYTDAFRWTDADPLSRRERYAHARIRVGYLSSDLHDHPIGTLTAGLFEQHDRSRFEVIAFSIGPAADSNIRRRLRLAFDQFHDVWSKTDQEIVELMRRLEIDIAVDLNGHTGGARFNVLSRRPAPIQVSYLGFPGTMGADYIDYILADRIVISSGQDQFYTEKVVYLPDCFQINDDKREISERLPSRMQAGLPEHGFVFCSFNNSAKVTPLMFDIWMRLLRQIEGSVLWLSGGDVRALHNLREEARKRGISTDRLIFASREQHSQDHLARLRLADLFLDTLPYNAHTTASDALWAGVPLVTCVGSTYSGRVAASLLHAIGLPELITDSLEEYQALALQLARNPELLASVKDKLARNRRACPLFDTVRCTRHIEAAYTTMWERNQRGKLPASFAVEPIS